MNALYTFIGLSYISGLLLTITGINRGPSSSLKGIGIGVIMATTAIAMLAGVVSVAESKSSFITTSQPN